MFLAPPKSVVVTVKRKKFSNSFHLQTFYYFDDKIFTNFINMKGALVFLTVTLNVMSVHSGANYDYFAMNETHIQEYRSKEDVNAGYPPIFMECDVVTGTETKSSCSLAHPTLNENEGRVIFVPNYNRIYYGCLYEMNLPRVLNEGMFKKELLLRRASRTIYPDAMLYPRPSWFKPYVNYYKYTCTSEVRPTLWRDEDSSEGSYRIGFKFINHKDAVLATIEFDHFKKIPLRTQHVVVGKSLGVPLGASTTREEIIYEEDSTLYHVEGLKTAFKSYYRSNSSPHYPWQGEKVAYIIIADILQKSLHANPDESEISMAHLIPEYDMVQTVWRKVAYFAQTIAPMWTELYLGVWADVEEMIREVAFQNQQTLSIYTGTHGQLAFKKAPPKKERFYLDENGIAVPELIWKLVINETPTRGNQQAVVIILHNVAEDLKKLDIFKPLEAPCESKCGFFRWNNIDKENMYCCTVLEVRGHIEELPQVVYDGNFDVFHYNVDG